MNEEQLENLIHAQNLVSHDKATVTCADCGIEFSMQVFKLRRKIRKYDRVLCPRHSMTACWSNEQYKQSTAEKISKKMKGVKKSEEARKQMAKSADKKWQTEEGKALKKHLSKKTAQQHANTNLDKSKRKVLYISAKNGGAIRVCNSSGEFVACEDFLEKDKRVVSYETQVYYEINERSRSLDFLVVYDDGSKAAIEVKPLKRLSEVENILQMDDSAAYAKSQGWSFEIWAERELEISNWKIARDRADEYRKIHHLLDYALYRKDLDRKRAKRYYDTKVAPDTVAIFCEFCQDYHVRSRKLYEKNVGKNGRFICIKENGSIVGKKKRKPKVSPYGIDMKRCKGQCDRVLHIDNFSKGKAVCKECRADHYKEKYRESK